SGDIKQAQKRAIEAKNGVEIGYAIPNEGAQLWFDNLAIPRGAPNAAEAHEFINYLQKPEVAAKNSNFISYANGNQASQKFVDNRVDVLGIDRRLVGRAHLVDLGLPLCLRQRRLIEHHVGGVAGQAIIVDRVRAGLVREHALVGG